MKIEQELALQVENYVRQNNSLPGVIVINPILLLNYFMSRQSDNTRQKPIFMGVPVRRSYDVETFEIY